MYETFYKLTARPFQLSPDPRFFYGSPGHKRAMSYLRYGISQGEGFIVITGDIGTGKTMLVRTLFSELSRDNLTAAQLVTTQLEAEDILRMVAASFGLAHEGLDKATLLKNLETFMVARAREGKRVLLVVDEAHNLPPRSLEELRMLTNFQLGGRVLFQSFLLGQKEFRENLQSPLLEQLRQRVIAAYHLEPLDEEQTRGYIEHRLRTAGWRDDPGFTDQAHALIYESTGGIPRKINMLCDRLLLFGCLEELHELDRPHVQTVLKELEEEKGAGLQPAAPAPPPAAAPAPASPAPAASGNGASRPQAGRGLFSFRRQPRVGEVQHPPADLEERLARLEGRVARLEEELRRERQRLRRLVLLSEELGGWEDA